MMRTIRTTGAPGAILAIGALVASLAGCGPAGAGAATPSPAPTATPSPTARPTGPQPIVTGPLAAGPYTTTAFVPTFTFTLPEGWHALFEDDSDEMAIESGDGELFYITRPTQVIDTKSGLYVDTPDDLVAWLGTHPSLTTAPPEPVVVSGIASQSVDVLSVDKADVTFFHYPTGNMHFQAGLRLRLYVVPLDGVDLVIIAGGKESDFADVASKAKQIVDSLAIVTG